ncbi:MAG: hypothetical protein ABIV50_02100 [Opitutus sp.]
MIFDFDFESSVGQSGGTAADGKMPGRRRLGLQLPLSMPEELFDLSCVEPSAGHAMEHFASLELIWRCNTDAERGGVRCLAVLSESERGGVWGVLILEQAGTGIHQHNHGGAYGECVITLAGQLADTLDDGTAITLRTGDVMFHAQRTIHEAIAETFWVGLFHQPAGSTELSECG